MVAARPGKGKPRPVPFPTASLGPASGPTPVAYLIRLYRCPKAPGEAIQGAPEEPALPEKKPAPQLPAPGPTKTAGPAVIDCVLIILLTWAAIFAIRFTAPATIMDDDQERPLSYMLDAAVNGNWIVQRDPSGSITSKPPLFTWICATIMAAAGDTGLWVPYTVNGLATLGTLLLIFFGSRTSIGNLAALVAAIIYQLSMMGARQLIVIRTDPLFTFFVVAAALAAVRAACGRGSWMLFWVLGTLATLTKGPLGVGLALLAVPGALLIAKSRDAGARFPFRPIALGIALWLAVCGGWLLLAYAVEGQDVIDKMIGKELVGHAIKTPDKASESLVNDLLKQPSYFLKDFAPWSAIAIVGLLLLPFGGRSDESRRILWPMAGMLLLGLTLFSLVPHRRAILLMPLIPAAAMIAGPALVRFASIRPSRGWLVVWLVVLMGYSAGFGLYCHMLRPYDKKVEQSQSAASFARELKIRGINPADLTFVDTNPEVDESDSDYAVQFYLGRMQPLVSASLAEQALDANEPFIAVVMEPNPSFTAGRDVLLAWPPQPTVPEGAFGKLIARLRPKTTPERIVLVANDQRKTGRRVIFPPHSVSVSDAEIVSMSTDEIVIKPTGQATASLLVKNHSKRTTNFAVRNTNGASAWVELDPGEKLFVAPTLRP